MGTYNNQFLELTGSAPFPWQVALYDRFIRGDFPDMADIPTGLGKTSVVAIWLIALLTHPDQVPRRLVYVVNRRTVVDQTKTEVERLRENLMANADFTSKLQALCAVPVTVPLSLSTLRGQFADNREWCADPARPAVIVGTVDMIGSGLLFSRYTCGFKTRPHHAGLLGQDVLLVHDEAHLEPAFQKLLESLVAEQKRCREFQRFHVLELTATPRGEAPPFTLTAQDEEHEIVQKRLKAPKLLKLIEIEDEKPALLATKLAELALARKNSGRAVMIFARSLDVVQKVAAALEKHNPVVLTGTMRGWERDLLVEREGFRQFLPSAREKSGTGETGKTLYLVATSAGEVGVNLSADDLICDLSTYESMAQRFGRVNRFGDLQDSNVEIVCPTKFDTTDLLEKARSLTLGLIRQLNSDGCPDALRKLNASDRALAFSPPPKIRPATDILFDAWAMTTLPWAFKKKKQPVSGCPVIAPYLHGEDDWQPPETYVAWRSEVSIIRGELAEVYPPEELLGEFPLKPHELLRDRSARVRTELDQMAKRLGEETARTTPVWLLSNDGTVIIQNVAWIADKFNEAELENRTLLLPPDAGGLSTGGLLDGKAEAPEPPDSLDQADIRDGADGKPVRVRLFSASMEIPEDAPELVKSLRIKLVINSLVTQEDTSQNEEGILGYWLWLESRATGTESTHSKNAVLLDKHIADVAAHAHNIVCKLNLPASLRRCVVLAAEMHDLGKQCRYWQRSIGNQSTSVYYAKPGKDPITGKSLRPIPGPEPYRHEFGSLFYATASAGARNQDADTQRKFAELNDDEKDIVLHLVAAHHGRARPLFPEDESFDPDAGYEEAQKAASEVPQRFARLQRRFGRWGLAYLESLLRSADYAASAEIKPLNHDCHD